MKYSSKFCIFSLIVFLGILLLPDFSRAACVSGHTDNGNGTCTATFYPDAHPETTTVDGDVGYNDPNNPTGHIWSEVRDANPGNYAYPSTADRYFSWMRSSTWYTEDWWGMYRSFFLFDTSSLPDDATISSAIFSFYVNLKYDEGNNDPAYTIYAGSLGSDTDITAADYDTAHFGGTAYADPIAWDDIVTSAYNNWTLNANGLAAIDKIDVTKFGGREVNYDVANVEPSGKPVGINDTFIQGYFSEQGAGFKPKLAVTYLDTAGSPDTTPPTRSNGSPSGALSAGTTQATLSLITNESATCKYGTVAGISYASLPNIFSTTGSTSHSSSVTGLTNGQSYTYYIRCQDTALNANSNDFSITFSVASSADTTPPVRSNGQPSGTLSAGTTQATLSLITNESATCKYGTSAGTAYASIANTFSTTGGISHSSTAIGLTNGTSYSYYVRCQDTSNNANTNDFTISFNIASPPAGGWTGWSSVNTIYYDPNQEGILNNFLQRAAQELQTYFQQMGKTLTINTTSRPSSGAIYLEVNASLPEFASRGEEAFKLYNNSNGVYITGKTAIAVRHGAYYLLDEKLGVRWFFKGSAWTVVPGSLADIGTVNEIHEPDWFARIISAVGSVGSGDSYNWNMRNRSRGAKDYLIWHSANAILDFGSGWSGMTSAQQQAYYALHPDYFLPLGSFPTYPYQLNPENPTIIAWSQGYAESILPTTRGGINSDKLEYGVASVTPRDGSGWYPPYSTSQQITNVVYQLANTVAAAVAQSYPGKYIGVYNYNDYSRVPAQALQPNIMSLITAGLDFGGMSFKNRVEGMVAKGIVVGWYDYVNVWGWGQESGNINYELLHRIKWLRDKGVTFYAGENIDAWGSKGLTYYALNKLLWDSDLNVDALISDFYAKAFGAAAPDMAKFFELRNKDNIAMAQGFNYLNSAMSAAAGNNGALKRIRQMSYYYRFIWKYHNVGLTSLSTSDLEYFYTFVTKNRDNYILAFSDLEPEVANRLVAIGRYPSISAVRSALANYVEPTATEAAAWLAEGRAAFSAYASWPEVIDPRKLNLVALGDTSAAPTAPLYGNTRTMLVYSAGNETITLRAKTANSFAIDFYNPIGLIYDTWDYASGGDIWVEKQFTTIEPGLYMIHVLRAQTGRPGTGPTSFDVVGRRASILATDRNTIGKESKDSQIHGAPEWQGAQTLYFYVPVGTTSFTFNTTVQNGTIFPVSGSLTDPNSSSHNFTFNITSPSQYNSNNEIIINSPVAGLWKLDLNSNPTYNYFWFRGIPPLIWHNPQYLLVPSGTPPPPPLSSFTVSSVNQLHLFQDQANAFQITGINLDSTVDFRMDFYQGANLVSTFTKRPTDSTKIDLSLTSTQTNTLAIGFYDLKVTKTTDSTTKTYSKQILVTTQGDIWSSTATDTAEQKRDGKVNLYDVSRMLSKWGSTQAADLALVDINPGPSNVSLNKIDLFDANLLMRNWRP